MTVDVLGIGCCAVDDVLYVSSFPTADSKMEVLRRERRCGGLVAVALMAASRLGVSCQYAGVLGDDELSRFALSSMRNFAVDTSPAVVRGDARPAYSVIVVDESTHSRTILYDPKNVYGADDVLPSEEQIRSSRVLCIDHYGVPGQIRASQIAREAKIPVVADFEADNAPRFGELLALVDHLILSRDFATRITGKSDPADAVQKLWNNDRSMVAVTAGTEGCWYIDRTNDRQPKHCPAFKVDCRDTTGCGDVFHGAYAAGLARRMTVHDSLHQASAAAALKAANAGGPAGVPTADMLDQFLKGQQ